MYDPGADKWFNYEWVAKMPLIHLAGQPVEKTRSVLTQNT